MVHKWFKKLLTDRERVKVWESGYEAGKRTQTPLKQFLAEHRQTRLHCNTGCRTTKCVKAGNLEGRK